MLCAKLFKVRERKPHVASLGEHAGSGVGLGRAGAGPLGSPRVERPPCVTGCPDLGRSPLEDPGEAGTVEKTGRTVNPIVWREQAFVFCFSG